MKDVYMGIEKITIPFGYKKGDPIYHELIDEGMTAYDYDNEFGIYVTFNGIRDEIKAYVELIADNKKIFGFWSPFGELVFYAIKPNPKQHQVGEIWTSKTFRSKGIGVWGA